ncbi:MAG: hypothetical protein R2682_01135 [Pyrinomonadaceae bacterium]
MGHLLREIESALRDVLTVFTDTSVKLKGSDKHAKQIRSILSGLGIDEDDLIAQLWLTNAPDEDGLARRAHRQNLALPRPVDEAFLKFWDQMQSVLDAVLEIFESRYLAVHSALDAKLLIEEPSQADANWIKNNVPDNRAALGYFFDKLASPKWLGPLEAEGMFKRPPEPITDPEKNQVYFPNWPASRYLVRMASTDSAEVQVAVAEIIMGLESTNFIIHLDILDAACLLPVDLATAIANKELEWLTRNRSIGHLVPDKFAELVVHLTASGNAETALAITNAALSFVQPEAHQSSAAENFFGPDPSSRLERWDYGQFIGKVWKGLLAADWEGSLILFCSVLQQFLEQKYPQRKEAGNSNSYIWHSGIEQDEDGVPNRLISTVRSIAEQAVAADVTRLPRAIEILDSQQWDVFQRIILHTLRVAAPASGLSHARLLSEDNFRNVNLFHEYVLLLVAGFSDLEPQQQETIMSWIDYFVPSIEEVKERRKAWDGTELSDEDAEWEIRAGRLRWLEPLKDVLPNDWKDKYAEWTAHLGRPDHPSYSIGRPQVMWASEPPVADTLSRLESTAKILEYLKAGDEKIDSPNEVARELSQLVGNNLAEMVFLAEQFKQMAPRYVFAFLSGIHGSAQSVPVDGWKLLLDLMAWVVNQPAAEIDLSDKRFDPPDDSWLQTRTVIVDLLGSTLAKEQVEIPFDLRYEVWSVIEKLTDDPNPTPAYEVRYGGTNQDPFTLSLNTIRGEAFHTLFKYINWCRKILEIEVRTLESTPEVCTVLEKHLKPENDPSLTVRAVYGERLPALVAFDPEWVANHLEAIFPGAEELRNLRKAAWETFIIWTRPWDNVFELVSGQYQWAIDNLDEETLSRSESPSQHLAEHLLAFYARQKIELDNESLLSRLYASASDRLAAHIFWFIGRILRDGDVSPEIYGRFVNLIEHRIAHGQEHPKEMETFGWLFTLAKFDPEWRLQRLRETLHISPASDPDYLVIETLSGLASDFPSLAIECLTLLVEAVEMEYKVQYWSPNIRHTITTAIEKGKPESAVILINKLAARGHISFRDLLPNN